MYKCLVTAWCFAISAMPTAIFAMQIKNVVDNETTAAKISAIDVTRIFVQGDRIESVKGVKGAYTRENDEQKGEIYIQPTPSYQSKAFTILIATEQGRHFTLLLSPIYSPSQTLMLVPNGVGKVRAQRFEESQPYEFAITELVRDMKLGLMPEGYVMNAVNAKIKYSSGKQFSVQLKAIYHGLHLKGEIYQITNMRRVRLQLDERQFYTVNTRAVSLDTIFVPPCGKINMYKVVSND